jgi:hypothetical protein
LTKDQTHPLDKVLTARDDLSSLDRDDERVVGMDPYVGLASKCGDRSAHHQDQARAYETRLTLVLDALFRKEDPARPSRRLRPVEGYPVLALQEHRKRSPSAENDDAEKI